MSDFGGNFYVTFALAGVVELPSQLCAAVLLRYIGRSKLFPLFMALTAVSCFAVISSDREIIKVLFALMTKFSINSAFNILGVQGAELFPTILRHTGTGSTAVVSRIGSISAPFMKNLVNLNFKLQFLINLIILFICKAENSGLTYVMVIYGSLTAVGSLLGLLLPETKDKDIPDTIEEAENYRNFNRK